MGAGHCLQVVLWIPIRVEYDYSVRCCQVDSQAASASGEEEAEVTRVFSIEMVQRLPSQLTTNTPI